MTRRYYLLGTLAATWTLYFWGMAMHLGLHEAIQAIPVLSEVEETHLVDTIQDPEVALQDGVSMGRHGLFLVVSTLDDGTDTFSGLSFAGTMVAQLLIYLVVGLVLSVIIVKLPAATILGRASTLALVGLAAGLFTFLPQHIWYGFGLKLTVVNVLDITGGWFISGLTLAALAKRWKVTPADTSTDKMAGGENQAGD